MKKIIILGIIILFLLGMTTTILNAAESNLIENVKISLKDKENPKRLEIIFDLLEPIDLSNTSSNIIYEYFKKDDNGDLESLNYKKDKTWSGYLNSYDNYPSGAHKYSSGTAGDNYLDTVPSTTIYTSTKTGASIDVTEVEAVKITVLRADSSGERITIYSDGTTSSIEKITPPATPVTDVNKDTGIMLQSTTASLPANTTLVTDQVTSGSTYNNVSTAIGNVKNFAIFNIKLQVDGEQIQPNGNVKVSIPIPNDFSNSNLTVHRINGTDILSTHPITVTTSDGIKYATFETSHFSTYALVDTTSVPTQDETPKTGSTQYIYYATGIAVVALIGIVVFSRKKKNESK